MLAALKRPLREFLKSAYIRMGRAFAGFGSSRECNICGWRGRTFLATGHGSQRRSDALCPGCGSLERQRLAYMLLRGILDPGQRTLHVAPEPSVARWLRPLSEQYLSIDVEGHKAMAAMDLTALHLPDASVSLVYASHVLEHIPDDGAAMSEMRRILAPGGLAVVQVPVRGDVTDEDPTITDPKERLRRFNQHDHVRVYGFDVVRRLERAGFVVELFDDSSLNRAVVERHRLSWPTTRQVFLCHA